MLKVNKIKPIAHWIHSFMLTKHFAFQLQYTSNYDNFNLVFGVILVLGGGSSSGILEDFYYVIKHAFGNMLKISASY